MLANRRLTGAMVVVLLIAAVAPAAASTPGGSADASISVTVEVTENATVVTVQEGGSAAAARVAVSAVGDAMFVGSGEFRTDGDGSVRLARPDEPVTVRVVVETDRARAAGVVTLQPPDSGEWRTRIELGADATASGSTGATADGSAEGDETAEGEASVMGRLAGMVPDGIVDLVLDLEAAFGFGADAESREARAGAEADGTADRRTEGDAGSDSSDDGDGVVDLIGSVAAHFGLGAASDTSAGVESDATASAGSKTNVSSTPDGASSETEASTGLESSASTSAGGVSSETNSTTEAGTTTSSGDSAEADGETGTTIDVNV